MPEYKKVQKLTNKGLEHLIDSYGSEEWYKDGKRHRLDGPAFISSNGTKHWYKDGERHREGGPAIIHPNGYKEWYKDGLRHRLDGPAVIDKDGSEEWYLEGIEVSKEEFNKVRTCPLRDLPLYINTDLEPLVKWRLKNGSI